MPSWWGSSQASSHEDHQEFTQKVCTAFKVPKECNQVKGMDNYYMHHQDIPPLESTTLCCQRTWSLAAKTFVSARDAIPLPIQGPCNIGLRRPSPHSQANLIIWWDCTRAPAGNASTHHLCRGWCLCHHGTYCMDRDDLTKVQWGHTTRTPEKSLLQ